MLHYQREGQDEQCGKGGGEGRHQPDPDAPGGTAPGEPKIQRSQHPRSPGQDQHGRNWHQPDCYARPSPVGGHLSPCERRHVAVRDEDRDQEERS